MSTAMKYAYDAKRKYLTVLLMF